LASEREYDKRATEGFGRFLTDRKGNVKNKDTIGATDVQATK
jgi:hypothetical protein